MKKKKHKSNSKTKPFKHTNPFKKQKDKLLKAVEESKGKSDKKSDITQEVFYTNDTEITKNVSFMENLFPDVNPLNSNEKVPAVKQTITPKIIDVNEENSMEYLLGDFFNSEEGFSGGDFNIEFLDEFVSGIAPGEDVKILYKLKKGEYSYQSYLDLHGYTWDEAKEAILSVITDAQRDGKRCILVVHGRGLHSKTNRSVLKNNLINMLTRSSLRKKILAFSTALPVHGGPGSLYILLRKSKT